MKTLRSILKMILGLIGGIIVGLLIAALVVLCFTDTTFAEFFKNLVSAKFTDALVAAVVGFIAFVFSIIILIPLHEAGHLVCGLLSGYKFVSFRIFSFTFIRLDGKLLVKKYAVAGTGGQCLLTPPDLPIEKIPTVWYNFGGVLANIIAVCVVIPLLFTNVQPLFFEAIVIFILTAVLLIVMNGVPMKISGTGNDAYNMLALRKNMLSKRGLVDSLRANAMIQNGVRPKDMPDKWFIIPSDIDYSNQLEISIPMMAASRLIDEMNYQEALRSFEKLYEHKQEIISLYVKEIECELVFLRLMCGHINRAQELLTPELKKYIDTYSAVMSSKERILCAISLIMENDVNKAIEIYNALLQKENEYLLQGEVKSDIAIMKAMLENDKLGSRQNKIET